MIRVANVRQAPRVRPYAHGISQREMRHQGASVMIRHHTKAGWMRALSAAACGLVCALGCGAAAAGEITYTPINPSFGGNTFNAQNLMAMATAQNSYKRKADEEAKRQAAIDQAKRATGQSAGDRFVQQLQSRLYASLADQVAGSIFGENAQQQGTLRFDDQEISFVNNGTEIQLTIHNFTTGETTEISVPTLTGTP
jgi:curli production assembly/transport component CsgF